MFRKLLVYGKIFKTISEFRSFNVKHLHIRPAQIIESKSTKLEEKEPVKLLSSLRNDQIAYITKILSPNVQYSTEEWDEIFKNILDKGNYVTKYNIAAMMIGFCTTNIQFFVGKSLLEYLNEKQLTNIATLSKFLKLCYEAWPLCDEETILNTYGELMSKVTVLDATTAENIAMALSLTAKWEESIRLLETIKITCSPSVNVYSSIVAAAFNNSECDTGWKLAKEAVHKGRKLKPEVYKAYINYCSKHIDVDGKLIEKMFNFLSENNVIVKPYSSIQFIQRYLNTSKIWSADVAIVSNKGECAVCRNTLQDINLTREQFELLQNKFFDTVLLGRDVFTKSTPEEVEKFEKFLTNSYPYDVVIDGLNVAYSIGASGNPGSSKARSSALRSAVESFVHQGLAVMILGRRHMIQWPKYDMEYIKRNASVFLASDLTQDDLFLLYAALKGGPQTYFVSRDFMRSHAFKLNDPNVSNIFRRWQQWRQYTVTPNKFKNQVRLIPPVQFLPSAQKMVKDGQLIWHIPYLAKDDDGQIIFDVPTSWLCVQERKRK